MSTINVESTTDTPEEVLAVMGKKADVKVEDKKAASPEQAAKEDETKEVSETSDKETSSDEVETSDADSETGEDEETDEDKPKKKLKGVQKRVDKLVRQRSDAQRDRDYWRDQALRAQAQAPSQSDAVQKEAPKAVSADEPSPDNFESHGEYVKALTKHYLDQDKKSAAEKANSDNAKTAVTERQQKFNEKVSEFKKTAPDYDEALNDFISDHGDFKLSVGLEESLLTSDLGPALIYELIKDKKEVDRLNILGPMAVAREIGKLEAKLAKSSDSQTTTTQKSKAPAPISPISSTGSAKSTKSPDNMTYEEYKEWRLKNK